MGSDKDYADTDNYFQESFLRSGYPLQSTVSNDLSEHFDIQNQPPFYDLDDRKFREGDILAKEIFPSILRMDRSANKHLVGRLVLTIECKNLPDHGWIFTEGKIKQNFWHFSLRGTEGMINKNLMPLTALSQLVGTDSFLERIIRPNPTKQSRSNQRTNNIHDSSIKVIKLTRHIIEEDKKQAKTLYKYYNRRNEIVFFEVYQPVIIFNGNLFVKRLNQERLQRIKYLQLNREYKTLAYDEYATIHVVSAQDIQEYIEIIRLYYMVGSQYIIDHQNQILNSVKGNLISWNDFNPFRINF